MIAPETLAHWAAWCDANFEAAKTSPIPEFIAEIRQLKAENERLRAALQRNRQGYLNILEMRKFGGEWGQRDGFACRYGALTREETEGVIADIDTALHGTSDTFAAGTEWPKEAK